MAEKAKDRAVVAWDLKKKTMREKWGVDKEDPGLVWAWVIEASCVQMRHQMEGLVNGYKVHGKARLVFLTELISTDSIYDYLDLNRIN